MTTGIEWTDEVWNVVTGCSPAGAGCANCYAKRLFPKVYGRESITIVDGPPGTVEQRPREFTDVRIYPDRLDKPLHWRKPRRIFTCSMGDLFHEAVPFEFIAAVFGVMAASPRHTFQVLTKRPERMRGWFEWLAAQRIDRGSGSWTISEAGVCSDYLHKSLRPIGFSGQPWPLPNVWLGASASTQADLARVVPELLASPAAVRFLSLEPLLEAVDVGKITGAYWVYSAGRAETPHPSGDGRGGWWADLGLGQMPGDSPKIDWIIVGCESGPTSKRRPMEPDWARSVVEQCRTTGVPVFVKQLDISDGHCIGRVSKDPTEWSEDLRVREMPQGELR